MERMKIRSMVLLVSIIFLLMCTATAQHVREKGIFFSTEEEFVIRGLKPADGNPIISDGDLLNSAGYVYMRNYELLKKFKARSDLGLDAADVINIRGHFVAFSTELDHPYGGFTAGDLLATNGAIVPNAALLANFNIPRGLDLGLDAVQIIGTEDRIIKFFDAVRKRGREYWIEKPKAIGEYLKKYGVDIWFSTEGTGPLSAKKIPMFLDGDLLSAAAGTIVLRNRDALPVLVPAGIPSRGVDFGMDAVTFRGREKPEIRKYIYYSSEILFEGRMGFTDGDVLKSGNGIVMLNSGLILPFKPKTKFLGLDALSFGNGKIDLYPQITHFNQVHVSDISITGLAYPGAPGREQPKDQPFGQWIQIHGYIPDDIDIQRFRVVYCKASDHPCSITEIDGIEVTAAQDWHVKCSDGFGGCNGDYHWFSDSDGWFNAAQYRTLRSCNPDLPLTMWNSVSAPDKNALYVVWLQIQRGGGVQVEPFKHYIQLDNTPPTNLALAPKNGNICGEFGPDNMPIMVQGRFKDDHFWRYRLTLFGGDPLGIKHYGWKYHDDSPEGDFVDPTGTIGPSIVDLHEVNINNLPVESIDDCAYAVTIHVRDRTIRGYMFDAPNDDRPIWTYGWYSWYAFTFDYTP
ncbi:MAG: hypothetical protein GTO45_39170 [Candidatus Aminicenantes bacterium]|nr:hypothetical protein [Candidatus Aminicenantes bacterium]NIM84646.1 hypothetical protein [Candidatus Aminicenantes bacterium]NIN24151.1 hypothetical protein [Candidatus Aminicenantes bacterium]NIN47875.1 hypothetical protein [Candidatus Aminicenantes bacterium]NIN90813.1 hypothetical protein [Candidatus Aminicenantes bacterium]